MQTCLVRSSLTAKRNHIFLLPPQEGEWLKDEVINFFIGLLRQRHIRLIHAALVAAGATDEKGLNAGAAPPSAWPKAFMAPFGSATMPASELEAVIDGLVAKPGGGAQYPAPLDCAVLPPDSPLRPIWMCNTFFWAKLNGACNERQRNTRGEVLSYLK